MSTRKNLKFPLTFGIHLKPLILSYISIYQYLNSLLMFKEMQFIDYLSKTYFELKGVSE